LTTSFHFYIST